MIIANQKQRREERESLKEIIRLKFKSIKRFCDVTKEIHYSSFRNMLLRDPISDWQLIWIRRAKELAMKTSNQKLPNEIKNADIENINRALRERGMSQNRLSKELGVPRSTLRDILDYKVKRKNDLFLKILEYLEI